MESSNPKFPDDPSVTLTIRLIMQGKVSHLLILFTRNVPKLSQLSVIDSRVILHSLKRCKSNIFKMWKILGEWILQIFDRLLKKYICFFMTLYMSPIFTPFPRFYQLCSQIHPSTVGIWKGLNDVWKKQSGEKKSGYFTVRKTFKIPAEEKSFNPNNRVNISVIFSSRPLLCVHCC